MPSFPQKNMTESVHMLSSHLPEGYKLVCSSVRGSHLFGMQTETSDVDVEFLFKRPLSETLLQKPSALRFTLPEIKDEVVGHDVYEVLVRLADGNASYLHYFFNLLNVQGGNGYPEGCDDVGYHFGQKPSAAYRKWLYCSNEWHSLLKDEKTGTVFLTQKLVKKSQKKAKSFFMSWADYMANNADHFVFNDFVAHQKKVHYALRELGWLLRLLVMFKEYPANTPISHQMFVKAEEGMIFHNTLKALLDGKLPETSVHYLYENLSDSLNAMSESLPPTTDMSVVNALAVGLAGF